MVLRTLRLLHLQKLIKPTTDLIARLSECEEMLLYTFTKGMEKKTPPIESHEICSRYLY